MNETTTKNHKRMQAHLESNVEVEPRGTSAKEGTPSKHLGENDILKCGLRREEAQGQETDIDNMRGLKCRLGLSLYS